MNILSGLLPTSERKQTCIKKSTNGSTYNSNDVAENETRHKKMIARNMDSTKYNIPSYYVPKDDETENDMGMWANTKVNKPDEFTSQFELQGQKKSKLRAANDMTEGISNLNCLNSKWAAFESEGDDMTLGVHDKNSDEFKNTNMGHDSRMRDFAKPDFKDNRVLESFTGEDSFKQPKNTDEIAPLFAPTQNVFHDDGAKLMMEEEKRYRELIGDKKNGQTLSAARQVAPRLDLTEDQDTILAGPDLTRIMPDDIDVIRGQNKQNTMTMPMIGGKKGDKRATIGAVEVRRNTLVDEDREVFASGGFMAPKQNDKIITRSSDKITEGKRIGIAKMKETTYNPGTEGKISTRSKVTYTGYMGIASARDKKASIDPKSIILSENQRSQTNFEQFGNIHGSIKGVVTDKNMKVKGKQFLSNEQHMTVSGSKQGHGYNRNDKVKGKQFLSNEQHMTVSGNRTNTYNTNAPDATIKQAFVSTERSSFMNPTQKMNRTEIQDKVRNTNRQNTTQYSYNGPVSKSNNNGYQRNNMYVPLNNRNRTGIKNYSYPVGSSGRNSHNPALTNKYEAPTTIKQTTMHSRVGGASDPYATMDQTQYYNADYNDIKEATLENRMPMGSGPTALPNAENIGEVQMPNNNSQSYDRIGNLDIHGLYNSHYNMEAKVEPMYGDRIGLYDMRDPNSHIQKSYYDGTPQYEETLIDNSDQPTHESYQSSLNLTDINEKGHNVNHQMYNEMYVDRKESNEFDFPEDEYKENPQDVKNIGDVDYYSSAINKLN